jgi:hypothetical protein
MVPFHKKEEQCKAESWMETKVAYRDEEQHAQHTDRIEKAEFDCPFFATKDVDAESRSRYQTGG